VVNAFQRWKAMRMPFRTFFFCLLSLRERKKKDNSSSLSETISPNSAAIIPSATPTSTGDIYLGTGELVTASKDKTVKVWDLKTGECKFTLRGHSAPVHSLQIFEKNIASGSLDHSIRLWDMKVFNNQKKKGDTTMV